MITQFDHRRHQVGRIICIFDCENFQFSATQKRVWLRAFSEIISINWVCQSPNKTTKNMLIYMITWDFNTFLESDIVFN